MGLLFRKKEKIQPEPPVDIVPPDPPESLDPPAQPELAPKDVKKELENEIKELKDDLKSAVESEEPPSPDIPDVIPPKSLEPEIPKPEKPEEANEPVSQADPEESPEPPQLPEFKVEEMSHHTEDLVRDESERIKTFFTNEIANLRAEIGAKVQESRHIDEAAVKNIVSSAMADTYEKTMKLMYSQALMNAYCPKEPEPEPGKDALDIQTNSTFMNALGKWVGEIVDDKLKDLKKEISQEVRKRLEKDAKVVIDGNKLSIISPFPVRDKHKKDYKPKKKAEKDKHFVLENGRTLHTIEDLYLVLGALDHGIFSKHVSLQKNDFSNWIEHVFKEKELAQKIRNIYDQKEMADIILTWLAEQDIK